MVPGPIVACAALLTAASPAAAQQPLVVGELPPLPADGATVASIEVSGGPSPLERERPDLPNRPWLSCAQAATFIASESAGPGLLAPARREPAAIECTLHLRDVETPLTVETRPPGDGLYVELDRPHVAARSQPIRVLPFVMTGGAVQPVLGVRVAASTGTLTPAGDGELLLRLPDSKAPGVIVLAFTDGERFGGTVVPITGTTRLPVRTRRGVDLVVRVAGRSFGPLKANNRKIEIPLEVPMGADRAVIRAVDRVGNVTEKVVGLGTPDRQRVAAVATAGGVMAGGFLDLAVTIAAPDGRPAAAEVLPELSVERGSTEAPVAVGPGVWRVAYRAPTEPGNDRIAVRVAGDPGAGEAVVPVTVETGNVAGLVVELPKEPLEAGSPAPVPVRAMDDAGNPIAFPPLEVTIDSGEARVDRSAGAVIVTPGPTVPKSGVARLTLRSGRAQEVVELPVRAGPPAAATVTVRPNGRSATLGLSVRDAHGNVLLAGAAATSGALSLRATGGDVGPLRSGTNGLEAALTPDDDSVLMDVEVRAAERVLERVRVDFPGGGGWYLGATLMGGFGTTLLSPLGPRFEAAVAVSVGDAVRVAGSVGVGLLHIDDAPPFLVDQLPIAAGGRTADVLTIPIQLSARWVAYELLAFSVAAAVVIDPVFVSVTGAADLPPSESSVAIGGRAEVGAGVALGPGELMLTARFGSAKLEGELLAGEVEGFSLLLGYTWWFADLGG